MRRQRIELWTVETNEFTAHLLTSIGILPRVVQGARCKVQGARCKRQEARGKRDLVYPLLCCK